MNAKALSAIVLMAMLAMAQTTHTGGEKYLGAGIAAGLAGLGAGIALGLAGAAAMSALVERPQERIWYLIYLALAEAVAIYGLLIGLLVFTA
ncbi:H+transporting two-sector ATPase subunit C [Pyrobaculum neutrophilum]|uniref:H+transporting two-sector ATPase C subunit n=1 Tax=Pyrobaculum neutrophilum (strain DSM 2338 / JCM 9278 / NBRC 100436 / V24Sta) TaxID=444157 RepID=B1Y9Q0_PYRNV|nr:H+transporting two-sector ATPase subunit C [Pyrobaculum neutrophilum]ACB38972.1 H+transporting two-sector ATPase C subunit [Pyrobaculum neutrophilum V24Sta]